MMEPGRVVRLRARVWNRTWLRAGNFFHDLHGWRSNCHGFRVRLLIVRFFQTDWFNGRENLKRQSRLRLRHRGTWLRPT